MMSMTLYQTLYSKLCHIIKRKSDCNIQIIQFIFPASHYTCTLKAESLKLVNTFMETEVEWWGIDL